MPYFTERNNLRKEIEKTYEIDSHKYNIILDFCSKYFVNLAWKFPLLCPDDETSIYGCNKFLLIEELEFEIPSLIRDGDFYRPTTHYNAFDGETKDEFDEYAVLDFAEFIYSNSKDCYERWHHDYFNHNHLTFLDSNNISKSFKDGLNRYFERLGLLYEMDDNGEIKRVVSNQETLKNLQNNAESLKDSGLKELIKESVLLYLKPGDSNIQLALEKIWDAFERVKTYYPNLDKKESSLKVIDEVSLGQNDFKELIHSEFVELTKIGNRFRIRHHETDKVDFIDNSHKEYLFNRCSSLLSLCINCLKQNDD